MCSCLPQREFSLTFQPLTLYLNLVCNVIAMADFSNFHRFCSPRFHTCVLCGHNCTCPALPEHPNVTAGRFKGIFTDVKAFYFIPEPCLVRHCDVQYVLSMSSIRPFYVHVVCTATILRPQGDPTAIIGDPDATVLRSLCPYGDSTATVGRGKDAIVAARTQ